MSVLPYTPFSRDGHTLSATGLSVAAVSAAQATDSGENSGLFSRVS